MSTVNLVRKDILIIRWYFAFVALYGLMFGVITVSPYSVMLIGFLPAVMLMSVVTNLEMKSKSTLFTGSLPVRRGQIVAAKYLSVLLYLVIGFLMNVLLSIANPLILGQDYDISGMQIAFSTTLVLVFASVYYPLYYVLGPKGASVISYVTIFVLAMAGVTFGNMVESLRAAVPGTSTLIAVPAAALVLMLISWRISLLIFNRKDIVG